MTRQNNGVESGVLSELVLWDLLKQAFEQRDATSIVNIYKDLMSESELDSR